MNAEPRPGGDAIGRAVLILTLGAVALAALPALLAAAAAAALMRRHRLRYSWALLAAVPAGAPLLLLGPAAAAAALASAAAALPGGVARGLPAAALAAAPFWVALAPVAATAIKLWLDRRDQLHGGEREQRHRRAVGPLQRLRIRAAQRRDAAAPALTAAGLRLGRDDQGRPLRVPPLVAHATIVGGSNTGKTNTAAVLLEGMVETGAGFVVLDGKGGRDLPRAALALARRHQRPLALWSPLPYGDPRLDRYRIAWNAAGGGNPTEIKDRIATSEEQSEPYYEAVAARGLLIAARALTRRDGVVRLDELAKLLDAPAALQALLEALDAAGFAVDIAWLDTLAGPESSGLRGIGLRLHTMIGSDGGEWLLPAADGREIDLHTAIRAGWLVVFTLPQGSYPKLIPHVCRYAVSAVNAVAGRLEREGAAANSVLLIDELSAFDGEQLAATLERARSSGIRVILSTQSLSNFEDAGGPRLLHAALDNPEIILIHRQAVPETVELLASVGGTEEAWEHTHKVTDPGGIGRIGWDEDGQRARRLTDRFRAHPNTIKQLGKGEAIVISHRPAFQVRQLTIARGLPARAPTPAPPAPPARTA